MSGLVYAVNVNYVVSGGVGNDPGSRGSVEDAKNTSPEADNSESNAPKPAPDPPKPSDSDPEPELELELEPEPEPVAEAPKVEPEAPIADTRDGDAKQGLQGSESIESGPPGGVEAFSTNETCLKSNYESNSIDENGIENFRGIEGEEMIRVIKDLTSGDRIAYFTKEELEKAKKRCLCKRQESNPPRGPIGIIFKEQGKWMEKCVVHGQVSMEVEYLIDANKELRSYIRPGGPYKLSRYAVVNDDVAVCADYADWYYDLELRYVKDHDIKGYRKRRTQRWLSEVLPVYENERFDRYLVRCHAEALRELKAMNQEYEEYQNMFPHIVDKWVAVLHFGMLLKRRNMGKSCDFDESELIVKLLREYCEILYFKTKIIFFEEADDRRDCSIVPKEYWILHPKTLCGNKSPI